MSRKSLKEAEKKIGMKGLELDRETKISPIARKRRTALNIKFADPRTLEVLYYTVPEVGRALDVRAAEVVRRGYEITPFDNSEEAKEASKLCFEVLEGMRVDQTFDKGHGIEFIEKFFKNADLYGISFVELVKNDSEQIISLELVHPFMFGFEEKEDEMVGMFANKTETSIIIDEKTGNPRNYAQYKLNEFQKRVVSKRLDIDEVGYMSFRVVGDNFIGISLVQRMFQDVMRGLGIKESISDASDMTIPKMIVQGQYVTDEEQEDEAEKFAGLASDDVIVINDGKSVTFVQPGETQLPDFYDIFIKGVTTASGVPRPLLLSDGTEVNKATLIEMSKKLRHTMRVEQQILQRRMRWIFARIMESYGLSLDKVPFFTFPEDQEDESARIDRELKKASTLANLSNSVAALSDKDAIGSDTINNLEGVINVIAESFFPDDDVKPERIEELEAVENAVEEQEIFTGLALRDTPEDLKDPHKLEEKHKMLHQAYAKLLAGAKILSYESGVDGVDTQRTTEVTLPDILAKHQLYVKAFGDLGMPHPVWDELDTISSMFHQQPNVVQKPEEPPEDLDNTQDEVIL